MIEKMFYGRNGIDTLSIFLLLLSIPLMWFRWTAILAYILVLYVVFRCFSKNIEKRRAEEWKFRSAMMAVKTFFIKSTAGIREFFAFQSLKWKNRKTTVYFRCPQCKNKLSLPRHKGKLSVTCTVCGHNFIKKT